MHPAFCPPQGSSSAPYLLHGTLCTFTLKQSLVLTLWAALPCAQLPCDCGFACFSSLVQELGPVDLCGSGTYLLQCPPSSTH